MIVDDDSHIRLAVRELFEGEGYEVSASEGADECLEKLHGGFRGVILMDIMMPEKDGWDAIREIISCDYHKSSVIAMLTAKDAPGSKMMGLQECVIDYITKPFDPDALVAAVKEYFSYIEAEAA
jgi:DNA-binding response OmpR family regulator